MKTTILKSLSSIVLMTLVISASAQTITLTPNPALDVNAGPCTEISAGTTLTFNRSLDCDQDILITTTGIPPVELLQSPDAVVTYTFTEAGNYVVFCGAPATPMDVAVQAICVNVGPAGAAPIPTIGEWGLIFLVLLALIIGAVVLRQQSTSRATI